MDAMRVVLGKQLFQAKLIKALSSLSRVGFALLLDQVKSLSSSGSSINARSLIKVLKASASRW